MRSDRYCLLLVTLSLCHLPLAPYRSRTRAAHSIQQAGRPLEFLVGVIKMRRNTKVAAALRTDHVFLLQRSTQRVRVTGHDQREDRRPRLWRREQRTEP